jgi:hypothetical protein
MRGEYSDIPVAWACVGLWIYSTAVIVGAPLSHTWGARVISATFAVTSLYVLYEGGWKQDTTDT